jgi:hypothetical protein
MPTYNRTRRISGVSGRSSGGPRRRVGGHITNVPFQAAQGGEWGSAIFREFHRQQVRDARGRFAGGWGFAWVGLESCADYIAQAEQNVLDNLKKQVEDLKDEMVSWAKENAPWSDRTGNAREGLQGRVVWEDDRHFTIFLGHGPDIYYGIWLEVRWGGRFAIVAPTLEHFAPQLAGKLKVIT